MKQLSHYVFLFLLSFLLGVSGRTSKDLIVTLPHGGSLIGRHLVSHSGRGIRAFMGIPYAEPPVDELRFLPPVPAAPWEGERLAVEDSTICIQRDPFRRDNDIGGSEDCLYLNVYAPQNTSSRAPLPVMVFFHGGGWECGSGIKAFYGPEFLMDHDIVYVSGNFRLGPLGFLSTETPDCPGNNGLKDQVEILRWVQHNIAAFGGNPDSVTIFGESAGGASVTYHMMSEQSRGLFHKGISQSGTYLNPWAQPAHPGVAATRAKKLAQLLKCSEEDYGWAETLACLRTKSAESITEAFYDFFEWDTDPMIPFPPVVEPDVPGAFIAHHPRDEKSPHGTPLPWMAGLTSEEGALKTAALLNVPGLLADFKANFERVLPISLFYDHFPADVRDRITKAIDQFYFGGRHDWNKENHQNLTNLYTDAWFLSGLDGYLRLRLQAATKTRAGPTYLYLFDHKGEASFTEIFNGGREHYYGVCHAEELQYLFPVGQVLFPNALPSGRDNEVRETITEMWVNFARDGVPDASDKFKEFSWEPTEGYPLQYVRIGSQNKDDWEILNKEIGFFEERVQFWRELDAHRSNSKSHDEL